MSSHRPRVIALLLLVCALFAEEESVTVQITYLTPDGAFVDAGRDRGIAAGQIGVVRRGSAEVARVEVAAVTRSSARVRRVQGEALRVGDRVTLRVAETKPPETETAKRSEEPEEFVPLLERQRHAAKARQRRNVVHGTAAVRHFMQVADQAAADFYTTVLSSSGDVTRVAGRQWSLRWSGSVYLRGGDAFDGGPLEGAELDLYELSLRMRVGETSVLEIGRLLSRALTGTGTLDGALFRTERAGVGLGLQPDRDDLAPSFDHPTAFAYASAGPATLGVLARLFDGELDRLAVLGEFAASSEAVHVRGSFEVDLDTGAALVRDDGVRLTRLDLTLTYDVSRKLRLRTGVDHNERIDNAAERAALGSADAEFFDDGFWRGFVGAGVELAGSLRLDVELAVLDGPRTDDPLRWRVSLSGRGVTLTLYNLVGSGIDGVGGLLDAYLPLGRWTILPGLGFRVFDGPSDDITDVRLRVEYRASDRWTLAAGVNHVAGDLADATSLDVEVRVRW